MNFGITPFKITISKENYSLNILGFSYGRRYDEIHRSIGFTLSEWKEEDRHTWYLNLYFYWLIKRIAVKSILDDYYITCNHCGNPVWKHNLFCRHCMDELLSNEVTTIYCDPDKYKEEISQMGEGGYSYKIEPINKRLK